MRKRGVEEHAVLLEESRFDEESCRVNVPRFFPVVSDETDARGVDRSGNVDIG